MSISMCTNIPSLDHPPISPDIATTDPSMTESRTILDYILQLVYPLPVPSTPTTLAMLDNIFEVSKEDQIEKDPSSHSISHSIIPMRASESTLDYILRLVYPLPEPSIPTTLAMIGDILEASIEYKIEKITLKMKAALLTFADSDSVAVFAVACRLMLEDEANVAAATWKPELPELGIHCPYSRVPIDKCSRGYRSHCRNYDLFGRPITCGCHEGHGCTIPVVTPPQFSSTIEGMGFMKETERISAGSYFRLLRYFQTKEHPVTFCLPPPPACGPAEIVDHPSIHPPPGREIDADIILESRDGIKFPIHTLILSLASASEILDKLPSSDSAEGGLPIICLEEDATTLHTLIRLCYPFPEKGGIIDLEQLALARVAAVKYNIPQAVSLARELMARQIKQHPLQIYLLAKRHGWETDAEDATQECLNLDRDVFLKLYTPEMETSPAQVYYDLLKRLYEEWVARREAAA
ncbi:hypothetical protein NLI96_g8816 [Meripilus lineatus]|uniref:BTB domain-containing protein n=1 Tax=Meripilus lineatus TaxID=2056292 RepID=A0AAD5YDM3_9APHY|nr:hypothetical protein NLI96_g8816 [Physisporinus lineatus]